MIRTPIGRITRGLAQLGLSWAHVAGMGVLFLALAVAESVGIGLLMPVLLWVEQGPAAVQHDPSGLLRHLMAALSWAGLPAALWSLLLAAFLPFTIRQGLYVANLVATARLSQRAVVHLRRRAFQAFSQAELGFHVASRRAELTSAMTLEASRLSYGLTSVIIMAGAATLTLCYAALLCVISWRLTLVALPLFAVLAIVLGHRTRVGRSWGGRVTAASNELACRVGDAFSGIRLVKLRGAEGRMAQLVGAAADRIADAIVGVEKARSKIEATSQILLMAITFAIFYIAVTQLGMHLAQLGLFVFVVTRMVPQLVNVNSHRMVLSTHIGSLEKIEALIRAAAESRPALRGTAPFGGLRRDIRFEHISFAYTSSAKPVLRELDLVIRSGTTVALAGRSGAGKSTLVDLLVGFQRPTSGRILIDGVSLDTYEANSYRNRIGFVAQETVLFNESVRANLMFGLAEQPPDEAIWTALRQVNAHEFVDALPGRLDALVGEGGTGLSGGQRQRLGLARALLQNPQILILDEPTSALDSVSEEAIQRTLHELHGSVTIIIIAHRLATIQHADHIFVLEEGRLVAHGAHARLISESDTYRRLFGAQTELHTDAIA